MNEPSEANILQEHLDYYRARAGEYDEWWYRQGRYDRGPAEITQWFSQVGEVRAVVRSVQPVESILEVASGTGIWTKEFIALGQRVTAVDASPEVLAINRARLANTKVFEAGLAGWGAALHFG